MYCYTVFTLLLLQATAITLCGALFGTTTSGYCRYRSWGRNGTIKLRVVAGIHELDGGQCGRISAVPFPMLLAVDWITGLVNGVHTDTSETLIPGHTIGYDVFDNCDDPDLTAALLLDLGSDTTGTVQLQECTQDTSNTQSQFVYAGMLALTDVESSIKVTQLSGSDHLVLRPLPSSLALSSSNFPNLLQTAPPAEHEIQLIVSALQHFKWNFIALIFTDDVEGRSAVTLFKQKAPAAEICINFEYELEVVDKSEASVRSSSGQIIKGLEKNLADTHGNNLGVVFLGSRRSAILLLEETKVRFQQFQDVASLHWVFTSEVGRSSGVSQIVQQIGSKSSVNFTVSVAVPEIDLQDFRRYFLRVLTKEESDTPFSEMVDEYIANVLHCNIATDSCQNKVLSTQESSLTGLVDSVYTLLDGVRAFAEESCSNTCTLEQIQQIFSGYISKVKTRKLTYATISPRFLPNSLNTSSRVVDWTSEGHSQITSQTLFEVISLTGTTDFPILATYDGTNINMGNLLTAPSSTCKRHTETNPDFCPVCRDRFHVRYSYLPGKVLLLGLFSIRLGGDTPYTCGRVRSGTNDVITVSSFFQSILSLRTTTGIDFGGIAVDDCYSPFNTSFFLTDLFSKRVVLNDKITGEAIDTDKVCAIVGALASSVTMVVTDQATALGLPVISYGASSPELENRNRYPYFMRTVPSDTLQVKGMVQLIRKLNVTHVGAIFIDDPYGQNGITEFTVEASKYGICVEDPLPVTQEISDEDLRSVVETLYNTQSKVVVYFSIDNIALKLLKILAEESDGRETIIFIASEAWGTNTELIEGQNGRQSQGSIVFNIDTRAQLNDDFRKFLEDFNSSYSQLNRWAPNYWEDKLDCDFVTSFEKRHSKICDDKTAEHLPPATIETLNNDQRSVHVIQSVFSVGRAFQAAQQRQCNNLVSTACVRTLKQNPSQWAQNIRNVQLVSKTGETFRPFHEDGSGNIGFTLYNIQRVSDNQFDYIEIGSYNNESGLTFTSDPKFYNRFEIEEPNISNKEDTTCSNFLKCIPVCLTVTSPKTTMPSTTSVAIGEETDQISSQMLIAVFGSILAVLAIAVIILIVFIVRRKSPVKQLISDPSFTASVASHLNRSTNNIYDEPGNIQSGGRMNPGFQHPLTPASSRGSRSHSGNDLEDHVQYSPVVGVSLQDVRPRSRSSNPSMTGLKVSPNVGRHRAVPDHSRQFSHPVSSATTSTTLPRAGKDHRRQHPTTSRHPNHSPAHFRYPSDSHYHQPDMDHLSVPTWNPDNNNVFLDEDNGDGVLQKDINYITPSTEDGGNGNGDIHVTYLSAKDLELTEDEEEDAVAEASPVSYVDMAVGNPNAKNDIRTTGDSVNSVSKVQTCDEAKDNVTLNKHGVTLSPGGKNDVGLSNKTDTISSLSSVPDIIRYGPPHPVAEEEENFFV